VQELWHWQCARKGAVALAVYEEVRHNRRRCPAHCASGHELWDACASVHYLTRIASKFKFCPWPSLTDASSLNILLSCPCIEDLYTTCPQLLCSQGGCTESPRLCKPVVQRSSCKARLLTRLMDSPC